VSQESVESYEQKEHFSAVWCQQMNKMAASNLLSDSQIEKVFPFNWQST